ncbi:hypothetical protein B0E53_03820 [Micromonospora sp. MH33]|nr:hypothetical protein B0E53_03820 [Micromonospora sp. MH33]
MPGQVTCPGIALSGGRAGRGPSGAVPENPLILATCGAARAPFALGCAP